MKHELEKKAKEIQTQNKLNVPQYGEQLTTMRVTDTSLSRKEAQKTRKRDPRHRNQKGAGPVEKALPPDLEASGEGEQVHASWYFREGFRS